MGMKFLGEGVEDEGVYGYGRAVSTMPRSPQSYPPHRDEPYYNSAPGLSRSFPGFSTKENLGRSAIYPPMKAEAAAYPGHERRGQSFMYHQEEGESRHGYAAGYKEYATAARLPRPAPAQRYEQQKPLSYELDTETISPGRYQQQLIGQGRDNSYSRSYQHQQQQAYDFEEDHHDLDYGQVSSLRYPQQQRPIQPPLSRQPAPSISLQQQQLQPRDSGPRPLHSWN